MGDLLTSPSAPRTYRKLSPRKNFYFILAGDGAYAVSAWLMLVALIKLGSEELVGIYALGVAIGTPVITLTNLGLTGGLVTDSSQRCAYGGYLSLRLLTAGLSVVLVTAIVFAVNYSAAQRLVFVLVALSMAIAAIRELLLAVMKRNECMNLVGISQGLVSLLVLLAFTLTLWATRSLPWAVTAICGARLAVTLAYDLPHASGLVRYFDHRALGLDWAWRPIRELGLTTAPLGVAMALAALVPNIPRYVLDWFHGEEALGYFAAMAAVVALGTRVMSGLGTAVTPRLARGFAEDQKNYHRLTMKLLRIGLLMGAVAVGGAALMGRPVLTVMFTSDFAELQTEFVLLMVYLAIMFLVFLMNQALVASRVFMRVSLVNASICIASLAFSWWLIPSGGLRGACWAMIGIATCWLALLSALYIAGLRKTLGAGRAPFPQPEGGRG